jgi:hypothetical protein
MEIEDKPENSRKTKHVSHLVGKEEKQNRRRGKKCKMMYSLLTTRVTVAKSTKGTQ